MMVSKQITCLLFLRSFSIVHGIPFAGIVFSTAASKLRSEAAEYDQIIPRSGIDDTQRERRRDEKELSTSWLDGLEMEDFDPSQVQDDNSQYHSDVLNSLQMHPLLQIPCQMSVTKSESVCSTKNTVPSRQIKCFCDTGAQKTVMSARSAQAAGLWAFLDRRYSDSTAVGVGGSTCRVLGRIPPGIATLSLCGSVKLSSPAIIVLEDLCGVDLLLGLDFLRDHDAILDLKLEELQLTINGKIERVPFIKPRDFHKISTGTYSTPEVYERSSDKDACESDDQHFSNRYGRSRSVLSDPTVVSESDCEDVDEEDEVGISSTYRGQIDMSGV